MRSRRRAGLGAPEPGPAGWQRATAQRARHPRLEQASVTSASLTSAEQARLRALSEAARAEPPPGAARARGSDRGAPGARPPSGATRSDGSTRPAPAGPPALRRSTGLALTAVGAIGWLGVRVHVSFVEVQTAGFILFVTGLIWLTVPVRGKRTLARRHFNAAITYLSWKPATPAEAHASLDELLGPTAEAQGGSDP